jgi:lipopolysaccharide transport protein LptA
MNEVEVGDLLDFRRAPDRRSGLFCLLLRHLGSRVPALVAAGSLIAGPTVAQGPTAAREPIVVNSAFSNIDYGTNTAEFSEIVISQGDSRLTADRASATAVGFTNSQWTFVGRVVISSEARGTLRAEQAILLFREGELTQVTAIGSPAYIEQDGTDSLHPGRGHADQIIYDVKQGTIRLNGHAQLSDGRNEISAPEFLYNVRDEGIQADSPGDKRGVHFTIPP